jgi:hypothetical protein
MKYPKIHEIKVDEKSGMLTIESENIDKLTFKYYLIDTEILFSKSPFLSKMSTQFSYVKPYHQIDKEV